MHISYENFKGQRQVPERSMVLCSKSLTVSSMVTGGLPTTSIFASESSRRDFFAQGSKVGAYSLLGAHQEFDVSPANQSRFQSRVTFSVRTGTCDYRMFRVPRFELVNVTDCGGERSTRPFSVFSRTLFDWVIVFCRHLSTFRDTSQRQRVGENICSRPSEVDVYSRLSY